MDEPKVTRSVDPAKDVDGFHPLNAGLLYLGEPLHVPATPLGVMRMLEEHGVELKGVEAVVVGRSEIVGKPMASLLLAQHATVTICHSRTVDLPAHARRADILVAAVGRPGTITPDMVKPGATVIDVGVTRTDTGIVGDVEPAVAEVAGLLTPVPGGVGPMTIAMLLSNTLHAAKYRRLGLAVPGA
jgi:methylenetetrahydrofolate dehydrogenase (NADP+) / methenyltetrahydrofolate cyclohydrolase